MSLAHQTSEELAGERETPMAGIPIVITQTGSVDVEGALALMARATGGRVPPVMLQAQAIKEATHDPLIDPDRGFDWTPQTNQLTEGMIAAAVVDALAGRSFHRTHAGHITVQSGLTPEGEILLTIKHWRSIHWPEADTTEQVLLHVGAIIRTETMAPVITGTPKELDRISLEKVQ